MIYPYSLLDLVREDAGETALVVFSMFCLLQNDNDRIININEVRCVNQMRRLPRCHVIVTITAIATDRTISFGSCLRAHKTHNQQKNQAQTTMMRASNSVIGGILFSLAVRGSKRKDKVPCVITLPASIYRYQ